MYFLMEECTTIYEAVFLKKRKTELDQISRSPYKFTESMKTEKVFNDTMKMQSAKSRLWGVCRTNNPMSSQIERKKEKVYPQN